MRTKIIHDKYWFVVDVDSRPDHFFSELHDWLLKHCKGTWTTSARFVGFELEEDAMFYMLVKQ